MSYQNSTNPSSPLLNQYTNFDNIAKILLIGETGSGKSTFINYLYNYFHQGDLNNLKIAIPNKYHPIPTENFSHDEYNISDNTQSKTSICTQYMFTDPQTEKQYLFLDTPGLSDTRGIEQNEINMNKIIDSITQLGNLSSVIIVVNGSISRLTTYFRSIIASLNGNIPDIILENVIVILTNVKKHESTFDLKTLNLHGNIYPFYMQNNAFVSDTQTWTNSIRNELQINWNYSMKQIKIILQTIDSFKKLSINTFIQMKEIRNEIKFILHQARLEMMQIQLIQKDLTQLDLAFKQADQDLITYKNHIQIQTIEKIEIIDAPYHSTLCTNCNYICHNNCHLNETKKIGAQIFSQCSVMNNGFCQQCQNHCSYINHYHAKKTIKVTYETIENILDEFKKKYDQANENRNHYQEKIITINETKELIEKTLKEKIKELKKKSLELCQICSSFNLALELKYLIKQYKLELNLIQNFDIKLQNEQFIKILIKLTRLIVENQEKIIRKRLPMQIIYQDISYENKSIDINHLKTSDLIELHHKTNNDRTLLNLILEELYRRVQGKSIGPLVTSNEIIIINKFLEKYRQKTIQELNCSCRKIQKQIDNILNSNIFKIIDVDSELLIENFIIQTLMDEKEKNETNLISEITPKYHTESMKRSFSQPISSVPPYPINEPFPSSPTIPNPTSPSIGFSHILSAPYPVSNEPSSLLPPLPTDFSPIDQQSPTGFRLEDYRYYSVNRKSSTSSIGHQDSMPMPMAMSTNTQQRLTNVSNSNIGFSFQNSMENQHTMPDVVSSNNSFFDSPKFLRNNLIADLDIEKFRSLENSRLLLIYAKANLQQNEIRKDAVHQELQRRCYGDHPLLIKENKSLLEEKLEFYKMKTVEELLIAQAAIKQKIRGYLKNDDVTFIDDIPVELIVEVNALNQLIVSDQQT